MAQSCLKKQPSREGLLHPGLGRYTQISLFLSLRCPFGGHLLIYLLAQASLPLPVSSCCSHICPPFGTCALPEFPLPCGLLALKLSVGSHYLLQQADSHTRASPQGCRNKSVCEVRHVHPSFPLQLVCGGAVTQVLPPTLGPSDEGDTHLSRGQRTMVEELQKEVFHRNQGSPASAEHFGKEMPRVQDTG